MTLTTAITERLLADTAFATPIAGRIGTGTEMGGVPAARIGVVSDPRPQHFKGPQSVRPTLVQIDIWSVSAAQAAALRETAITVLTPPAVVGAVRFQRATVTNVRSGPERERGEGGQRALIELHRESIDFSFWHNG